MKASGDSAERSQPDQATYLKTEFLQRLAHELKGPVGVTLGALDEIELALGDASIDAHARLIAMARRGAKRVLRTAERLTRAAEFEAGTAKVEGSATDLRKLVEQAVAHATQLEARSKIRVDFTPAKDPCMASVDAQWLGIALGELVASAIRAAREVVQVEIVCSDNQVRLSVTDDRSSFIDAFPGRFEGGIEGRDTGLGYTIIEDIARAHGGSVEIGPVEVETPTKGKARAQRLSVVLPLRGNGTSPTGR